jgi:hypothetical protein
MYTPSSVHLVHDGRRIAEDKDERKPKKFVEPANRIFTTLDSDNAARQQLANGHRATGSSADLIAEKVI